jgi:hypothetical protein
MYFCVRRKRSIAEFARNCLESNFGQTRLVVGGYRYHMHGDCIPSAYVSHQCFVGIALCATQTIVHVDHVRGKSEF